MSVRRMSVFVLALGLLSATTVAGQAGCTTIVDALNALGQQAFLSTLQITGTQAKYDDTSSTASYTLFVPTNDAFEELSALTVALGQTVPTAATATPAQINATTMLLNAHMVSGSYGRVNLTQELQLTNLATTNLTIGFNTTTGTLTVKAPIGSVATITQPDAKASFLCGNSKIHLIDSVLTVDFPAANTTITPNATCVNIATATDCLGEVDCITGQLGRATAVQNPELITKFNSTTQGYTIFLPSDQAATPLFQGVANNSIDPATATKILNGHVVQGVYEAKSLANGTTLSTLGGTTITIVVSGSAVSVVGPAGDKVNVIKADFRGPATNATICGNSVTHVIDGLIELPKSPPAAGACASVQVSTALLGILAAVLVALA